MAEGALKNSKTQVSLAITGLAGADTIEKGDDGVVWFACAAINHPTKTFFKKNPGGTRNVLSGNGFTSG